MHYACCSCRIHSESFGYNSEISQGLISTQRAWKFGFISLRKPSFTPIIRGSYSFHFGCGVIGLVVQQYDSFLGLLQQLQLEEVPGSIPGQAHCIVSFFQATSLSIVIFINVSTKFRCITIHSRYSIVFIPVISVKSQFFNLSRTPGSQRTANLYISGIHLPYNLTRTSQGT